MDGVGGENPMPEPLTQPVVESDASSVEFMDSKGEAYPEDSTLESLGGSLLPGDEEAKQLNKDVPITPNLKAKTPPPSSSSQSKQESGQFGFTHIFPKTPASNDDEMFDGILKDEVSGVTPNTFIPPNGFSSGNHPPFSGMFTPSHKTLYRSKPFIKDQLKVNRKSARIAKRCLEVYDLGVKEDIDALNALSNDAIREDTAIDNLVMRERFSPQTGAWKVLVTYDIMEFSDPFPS